MVVALEPIRRAMSEAKKIEKGEKAERETGNYRLYRETMDKVVEIAVRHSTTPSVTIRCHQRRTKAAPGVIRGPSSFAGRWRPADEPAEPAWVPDHRNRPPNGANRYCGCG